MTPFRDFITSQNLVPTVRNIDSDAPEGLRQELVDIIFTIAEDSEREHGENMYSTSTFTFTSPRTITKISTQSMGAQIAGEPYGGVRYAVGRDIRHVEWPSVYDLIPRLWPESLRANLQDRYREAVNRVWRDMVSLGSCLKTAI